MPINWNVTRELQATLTVFVAGESPHDATVGDLEAACEAAGVKLEGEGWRLLHQCGSMCGYDILPGSPPITDLVRELRRKYDERGARIAELDRENTALVEGIAEAMNERDAARAEVADMLEAVEAQRSRAVVAEEAVEAARAEVAHERIRLRTTAQILIAEVGADGALDAEEAAQRAVDKLQAARAEVERLKFEYEETRRGVLGQCGYDPDEPGLDLRQDEAACNVRERAECAEAEVERLKKEAIEDAEFAHALKVDKADIDRMRPVVEAAWEWRRWYSDPSKGVGQQGQLAAAVDTYRAAKPENAPPPDGAPDRVWIGHNSGCSRWATWRMYVVDCDQGDTPDDGVEYLSRAYHDRLEREALERAADALDNELDESVIDDTRADLRAAILGGAK